MKSSDLHVLWAAPDNSHLYPKQFSFRLPVHVAAKLAALEEMYPKRTRTEIVGDLLSAALVELEKSLPTSPGEPWEGGQKDPNTGKRLFVAVGPGADFREKSNRHYQQLEREMGSKNPPKLYDATLLTHGKEEG
jgi:hypothetical protein